ncbi:ABC transporter substrate-binding protein [Arthrobacter wenxiniae]|uniref:Extracellular solute-binding protein n=1 Tax=Arthrobacter wenxiniae TaxID=2713570 RepID=A0A7Y7IE95_9MICC|nr:ABC transporter substrate-binding protein [Arthrobacter wenxiniae]NVM93861.1 extracellular solute-binding protein [Arthrobacter wenxiniae]
MSTRFRFTKALAVLAGAALALTACGGGTTGADAKDSGTMTYWSMWKVGEPQQKVIAQAISDFEKQTGATVRVQWQGRSNTTKLVPALNTSNVPDLVDGSYAKLAPVLGNTGEALPLTDAYASAIDGKKVSDLIPGKYLAASNIKDSGGQPWMLPYSLSSDAIWFNAAKNPGLAAAPPTNWDDFMALLNKEKAAGQVPLAADGDIAGYNSAWFSNLMIHAEGPGSLYKIASDKSGAAWDSPAVLAAAQKVQAIAQGGYLINGYNASKWPAQQQAWANGGADLLLNGSWIPTETGTYAAKGFQYSSFPFPAVSGQPAMARADFVGWAVPKKAKDPALAQKLAAFLLNKKYQDDLGTQAKVLPIRADAQTSPEMSTVKTAIDNAKEIYQADDGITFPGYTTKVYWPIDDQLFLGKINATQFVAKMKAAQLAYWKGQG